MGCNSSKSGFILSHTSRNANSAYAAAFPGNPKTGANQLAGAGGARKLSLPGETIPQRRRLSVVHIDGTGIVDEDVDRYVLVSACVCYMVFDV